MLTLVSAIVGWIVVILQILVKYFSEKKKHEDTILLKATEFFTGGTQKRSVGISLIEGIIKSNKEYYGVVVPLLANQFVYLLLQTNTDTPIHEKRNLVRIYNLLKEMIKKDSKLEYSKYEVLDAIGRRLEGDEKSTLDMSEMTLTLWQNELNEN